MAQRAASVYIPPMLLWLAFALMTGAAVLAVLFPLSRRRIAVEAPADADVYRARLIEIDRDRDRGVLGDAEADSARIEAARKLIAAEAQAPLTSVPEGPAATRRRRIAALAALIGVPLFALPAYLATGRPDLPGQPLAERRAADPQAAELAELVSRIERHLAGNPNDGRGHEVVAPVYARMGRFDDAARARREAIRLLGETPTRLADYGEALTAAAGGVVSTDAKLPFQRALDLDPTFAKARYYVALAAEQDGRRAEAITLFGALLADSAPDAPWREAVAQRLAELGAVPPTPPSTAPPSAAGAIARLPSDAGAIASLPQGEQREAIRGMVEGLAARLSSEGGDVGAWGRLIRSYMVLGEPAKARAARDAALKALPDAAARDQLAALAREAGVD